MNANQSWLLGAFGREKQALAISKTMTYQQVCAKGSVIVAMFL